MRVRKGPRGRWAPPVSAPVAHGSCLVLAHVQRYFVAANFLEDWPAFRAAGLARLALDAGARRRHSGLCCWRRAGFCRLAAWWSAGPAKSCKATATATEHGVESPPSQEEFDHQHSLLISHQWRIYTNPRRRKQKAAER